MRIAICLSGLPRCYNYYHESILNFFSPHEVDVFMHLWGDHLTDSQKDELVQIWKPKSIRFDNQKSPEFNEFRNWAHTVWKEGLRPAGRLPDPIWPMWYSVQEANELKKKFELENNFKYDVVCRLRTDMWFMNSTWTNSISKIAPKTIIVGNIRGYGGGIGDAVAMGDSKSMDAYSALYSLWLPIAYYRGGGDYIQAELMLRDYLEQGLKYTVIREPINYKIPRPADKGKPYDEIGGNANPSPPDNILVV